MCSSVHARAPANIISGKLGCCHSTKKPHRTMPRQHKASPHHSVCVCLCGEWLQTNSDHAWQIIHFSPHQLRRRRSATHLYVCAPAIDLSERHGNRVYWNLIWCHRTSCSLQFDLCANRSDGRHVRTQVKVFGFGLRATCAAQMERNGSEVIKWKGATTDWMENICVFVWHFPFGSSWLMSHRRYIFHDWLTCVRRYR